MKRHGSKLVYLIWIIFPVALYLIYLIFGLPHIIWSYSWRNDGQGHDPFANRYYTKCVYIGSYGEFTIHNPNDGECDWFIFRKNEEANNGGRVSG